MSREPFHSIYEKDWGMTTVCNKDVQNRSLLSFVFGCRTASLISYSVIVFLLVAFAETPSFGQCTLTCNDQKHISLSTSGYAIIYPELILNGDFSCASPVSISVFDENNNVVGDTLTCAHVGKNFQVLVRSASTGLECWSSVLIEDKLGPQIICSDTLVSCSASLLPEDLGYPSVRDNCQTHDSTNLKYFDLLTELPCGTTHNGQVVNARITRSWTLLDANGNVGTCTQNIYIVKDSIQEITFPGHRDDVNGPAVSCSDVNPSDPSVTGEPTINGEPVRSGGACKFFVTYRDQAFDVCPPASYRINRRWEITDLCTQEVRVGVQNILIVDRNAPVLTCPDSFSVFTNPSGCGATVILPQASATDSCSDVTIQPDWAFGQGYGPFYDVPVGTYPVTYVATDKCGNSSRCTTSVTITDNTMPTAICRDEIHIALTNNGFAEVSARAFDGGSIDNCGIKKWEVSRDTLFAEQVRFTCADINKPVSIRLKVYDSSGLSNTCVTKVIIDDEAAPTLICPPNVILDCKANLQDTGLTGFATATDNCGVRKIYYEDVAALNSCNLGTITRTWFAVDSAGNMTSCQQLITLEDQVPLSVSFPEDYTAYSCNADISPDSTGRPIVTGDGCENILVSHQDEIFLVGDSACMKILRTWTILDWCAFDPNDTLNGALLQWTQLIKIIDSQAPEITFCPEDITVGINEEACETRVSLPALVATDCNANITVTNTSLYADENGKDASGVYPIGVHQVRFLVSDGCGNFASCEMTITVEDRFAPTPVCKYGLTIPISDAGYVIVPPNVINTGSYDNCSDESDLIYEISPNRFTCEDVGRQTISLIVTDGAGNSQICTTDIFIQDNTGVCDSTSQSAIGGRIYSENGQGMAAVPVQLSGGQETMGYTDTEGNYLFENLSRMDTYTVRPMPEGDYTKGLSTFDLVLIKKHILGIEALGTPYKILAGDVNNSRSITTFDLVLIRQLILGTRNDFPGNTSWRYVDAAYEFPDPRNPFLEDIPEFMDYKRLLINDLERDFIGIKVGDVNNSAKRNLQAAESRNQNEQLFFELQNLQLTPGTEYRIPFEIKNINQIQGYQFTLEFDPEVLRLEEIIPGKELGMTLGNFGRHLVERGLLMTSWDQVGLQSAVSPRIFTLVFTAEKSGTLAEYIQINSRHIPAEAYDNEGKLMGLGLQFSDMKTNQSVTLHQNFPNPFEQYTTIAFDLPESADGNVSVFDISGKLLKSYYGKYTRGYNEIKIDLGETHIQPGVLYYQLNIPGSQQLSKRMVLIR